MKSGSGFFQTFDMGQSNTFDESLLSSTLEFHKKEFRSKKQVNSHLNLKCNTAFHFQIFKFSNFQICLLFIDEPLLPIFAAWKICWNR